MVERLTTPLFIGVVVMVLVALAGQTPSGVREWLVPVVFAVSCTAAGIVSQFVRERRRAFLPRALHDDTRHTRARRDDA
ncbi:hypothetical protein [Agromyces archimandritae]|uniref:Uncharacterized protein n=1 Tax=Agromyces archimandritae TaxID=2781962 RepID=A0A975FMJ7_9MICO|nr:hypothetical protein [Agromyces archimandritae]QTX03751.1 hypothetical protein G127AT_10475 [Agromyces archimandritae]